MLPGELGKLLNRSCGVHDPHGIRIPKNVRRVNIIVLFAIKPCIVQQSHQGYRLQRKTSAQTLKEALGIEEMPAIMPVTIEEVEEEP